LSLQEKERRLDKNLQSMGSVLIAFSGGVDSCLLLFKAGQVLGQGNVRAVTATSETYSKQEKEDAITFTRQHGFEHLVIRTNELSCKDFTSNPPDRCYFCKKELFSRLKGLAKEYGMDWVCDGANFDDTSDFRPGLRAARDLEVRSPLLEAELTKEDIRTLSRKFGLETWDKPAAACLSSRVPYGEIITGEKLARIGSAEQLLKSMGLQVVRVRCHGETARIEVRPQDFPLVMNNKEAIVTEFKKLGFIYITLDLEGFRSGSMNEVLKNKTWSEPAEPGSLDY